MKTVGTKEGPGDSYSEKQRQTCGVLSGSWGGRGPQGAAGSRAKAAERGGGPQGRKESRVCWGRCPCSRAKGAVSRQ